MSRIKTNLRTMFVLLVAFALAGILFRQEGEVRQLRSTIAELTSPQSDRMGIWAATNPFPADIEELRRDAAEVTHLRNEIAQLRREQLETNAALHARIDELAAEMHAIPLNAGSKSSFNEFFGGFSRPVANASLAVSHAVALANSSPEEAARWVAALSPGEEQNQAALAVIDRWIGSDPLAAATWTAQFEEGPLREQSMALVARHWGLHDWNATAHWLEKLPMGSSRDAAIGAFVTSVDGYDIRLAAEWANQMQALDSRATRLEQTARRWLREDNAAARTWLEKAQLPAGMVERLLSAK